jgi:hypothetical protein
MKFCATHPACEPATLNFKSAAFTSVRKAFASAGVGADDGFGGPPGALTLEQAIAIASWRTTMARQKSVAEH